MYSLDGPFVEYKGNIPADERGPILEKLKVAFQELLEEDIDTEIMVLTKQEAQQRCDRIKENYFNLDEFGDEPVRLVTVAGWTCPCGGTHTKSTGLLRERKWGITGLKYKKGIVKVKYNQDWENTN
jgi:Ser-tRNA(Ala) deacylase AlaX